MEFYIGNVKIKNQVVLAPIAGFSTPAFVQIAEEEGCGLAFTELISSEAIIRYNQKTFDMLKGLDEINIPVGIQIFGSNPEVMADAAYILEKKFKADLIDINMGCPAPKVALHSDAGSGLLKDLDKVKKIVKSVSNKVSVPVTVKIRSGWDEASINVCETAKICEENGAKCITVHPRTRSQGFSGKADWDLIKEVKGTVSVPVIGNGDITSAPLAKKMLDETGCDAVMIGRKVMGNPWILKQTLEYLQTGKVNTNVTGNDKIEMLKKHYLLELKYKEEKQAIVMMRSIAMCYLKELPNIVDVKKMICASTNLKEIFDVLDNYEKENLN